MISKYYAENLEQQLSKIIQHGFCVLDNFLTDATITELANEITDLNNAELMLEAGTGRALVTINKQLRGDSIYWLNEINASAAQKVYLHKMELLRLSLNQHLYLGLFALESHLAIYPSGAGYKKHIDKFNGNNNNRVIGHNARQISCILYLNQHWLEKDGGQLRIYLNEDPVTPIAATPQLEVSHLDISPIGGRLVIFLSDSFYHEVMPTTKDRMSLTGWFLTR